MSMLISSAYQRLGEIFGRAKTTSPTRKEEEGAKKTAQVMQKVLDAKQAHVKTALDNKWDRYNPVLIGGDIFTVGYLAFQGVQCLKPSVQILPAVGIASFICGEIAGAIFIGVGLVSLKESLQAFRNGDKVLGLRLLLDFFGCVGIGTVMILTSLAIKVGALSAVGAFFAMNPWVLPVLFFIITIPLLSELGYRINNIVQENDLGSKLKLNELKTLLSAPEPDWNKIDSLYEGANNPYNLKALDSASDEERAKLLSEKMEQLQADLGVTAAVEVFTLLLHIKNRKRNEALEQIEAARKKIEEWNWSLYVRMFQQLLFIVSFAVSMVALSPKVDGNLLNGTQNFAMMAANGLPLYMDAFWPFKRNAPIVVPKVEMSEMIRV